MPFVENFTVHINIKQNQMHKRKALNAKVGFRMNQNDSGSLLHDGEKKKKNVKSHHILNKVEKKDKGFVSNCILRTFKWIC